MVYIHTIESTTQLKRNELLIFKLLIFEVIMLTVRNQLHKNTVRFHLYKILKNADEPKVTESRPVVAWGLRGSRPTGGQKHKGAEGDFDGHVRYPDRADSFTGMCIRQTRQIVHFPDVPVIVCQFYLNANVSLKSPSLNSVLGKLSAA